jgi:hypothetical protein
MVNTAYMHSRQVALSEALASSYWREEDARRVLDAWESSGESLQDFAQQHDVDVERLYRWKRRLAKSPHTDGAQFVRLTLQDVLGADGKKGEQGQRRDAGIEVVLRGDRRLRLQTRFDEETLRRVMKALEEVGC